MLAKVHEGKDWLALVDVLVLGDHFKLVEVDNVACDQVATVGAGEKSGRQPEQLGYAVFGEENLRYSVNG